MKNQIFNTMPNMLESSVLKTAIQEFSVNDSHENWIKLSKVIDDKNNGKYSIRTELLRGIVSHILSSK